MRGCCGGGGGAHLGGEGRSPTPPSAGVVRRNPSRLNPSHPTPWTHARLVAAVAAAAAAAGVCALSQSTADMGKVARWVGGRACPRVPASAPPKRASTMVPASASIPC